MPDFLIVDDDAITCFIFRRFIERIFGNARVTAFMVASEGLRYLEELIESTDNNTVLILDVSMPILDGWDVLEELEKYEPTAKKRIEVYIATNSIDPEERLRAESIPMVKCYCDKLMIKDELKKLSESLTL